MSYLLQVQRGIDNIEEHLDQEIDVRDVSRIAGASHWHFQRMFKAMTLETLRGDLRSRRLANASSERHSYGADIEIYGSEYSAESEDSIMSYAIPLHRNPVASDDTLLP